MIGRALGAHALAPTLALALTHAIAPTLALGVALALLVAGCSPDSASPAPAAGTAPRLLLLGGRAFAGGDRAARRLSEMLAATGIGGDLAVELLAEPGADPARLAELLARAGPARGAIALLGDLALMDGIDPAAAMPEQQRITSRAIDLPAFDAGVDALARAAQASGTRLVIATPPLGIQGRVEVPELMELAARLRQRGPVLDLTAAFTAREPGPLFTNGVDLLDDYGHDLLAHLVYRSLLGAGAPLPPADALEKRRRQVLAALHAWADGDEQVLERALEQGLGGATPDPRLAVQQAALRLAARGLDDTSRTLWHRLLGADPALPGLAAGLLLAGEEAPDAPGFEGRVVTVLRLLAARDRAAIDAARDLAEAAPERIEAWLLLTTASALGGGDRGARAQTRSRLIAFDDGAVSDARAVALLEQGPRALTALPALLVVGQPYAGALVNGGALRAARRRARLDMPGVARVILDQALAAGPCPPNWRAEREALDPPR